MGLGKTIQTITALCYCKENQTKQVPKKQMTLFDVEENQEIPLCSILIMPTSLIFNWQIEIAKFAPQLSIFNYTGPNRKRKHNELTSFDIIPWFSPPKRTVLFFDELHISKSLKKELRRSNYNVADSVVRGGDGSRGERRVGTDASRGGDAGR